jgi:type II secretion system protein J
MAARVPYGIGGPAPQLSTSETAGRPADRLAMLTLSSPGAPPEGAPHGGTLQRIRYVLNTVPDSKTLALQRAVGAASEPQIERMMVVHRQVQALRVRYFDGQAWFAEWQRAELPRAVEITLMVQSGGAQAHATRFATLVTAD